jgi:hypothetical protein
MMSEYDFFEALAQKRQQAIDGEDYPCPVFCTDPIWTEQDESDLERRMAQD